MSETTFGEAQFSKFRSYVWPIHRHELKKFVPMLLVFFLLTFDYNILRVMKDTIVVTAKGAGAEVIPFIKVWVMFPGAILMTILYTRLTNYYSREKVFYLMISFFLGFFAFFAFVLYPLRDSLHPHDLADRLQASLPLGFKGFVAMFRNWTFSLFYAMSELWSNIVLFVLCWGFANQITQLHEAKRFYGLFGIGINFSGVAAGVASTYLCSSAFNPAIPIGNTPWEQSMYMLVTLVIVAGFLALLVFKWMNESILTDPRFAKNEGPGNQDKVKQKLSLRESFSYLMNSKYIMSIAIIMIAYNVVINLVEVLWKDEALLLYNDPKDYNLYMNQVSTVIGVIATFTALFISGNSIRKFGWTFTALLTPVILVITSIGFFGFFFMKGQGTNAFLAYFNQTAQSMVVFFGGAQNVLSRAAKYTVFDATKEMSYIPLSREEKIKGKAAIDGICSRLGKSGGSIIHQTLLFLCSTFTASAPYVFACLLSIIGVWIVAVGYVGKQFNILVGNKPAEDVTAEAKDQNLEESAAAPAAKAYSLKGAIS